MAIQYKQKCSRCKKNYVVINRRQPFPVCFECHEKDMQGEIKDPEMKKLFDIPEEYYKKNAFLRSIKINYLKFENLTDKQIEAFKKTVDKMKQEKKG